MNVSKIYSLINEEISKMIKLIQKIFWKLGIDSH